MKNENFFGHFDPLKNYTLKERRSSNFVSAATAQFLANERELNGALFFASG